MNTSKTSEIENIKILIYALQEMIKQRAKDNQIMKAQVQANKAWLVSVDSKIDKLNDKLECLNGMVLNSGMF